ncbi:hypothetical protein BGZ54_001797, partial [Gamsiella multidivaricata]
QFCDELFENDYIVEPKKTVRFLEERIFTRTKIVLVDLEKGYSGVIGATMHDPAVNPVEAAVEANAARVEFFSEMDKEPDNATDDTTENESEVDSHAASDDMFDEYSVPSPYRIRVPVGKETVEAALKALVHE